MNKNKEQKMWFDLVFDVLKYSSYLGNWKIVRISKYDTNYEFLSILLSKGEPVATTCIIVDCLEFLLQP